MGVAAVVGASWIVLSGVLGFASGGRLRFSWITFANVGVMGVLWLVAVNRGLAAWGEPARWVAMGLGLPLGPLLAQAFAASAAHGAGRLQLVRQTTRGEFLRLALAYAAALSGPPGAALAALGLVRLVGQGGLEPLARVALVLALFAHAAVAVAFWTGVQSYLIPGRLAPVGEGPLRDSVAWLAARMGIGFRTLAVARSRRGKLAGAHVLGSGTIVVSDSLVSALDRSELSAVLAHELEHIRLRRQTVRLLLGGTAGVVVLALGATEATARLAPERAVAAGWAAVAIGFGALMLAMRRLKARHEDLADDAAARYVGPDFLVRALAKIEWINRGDAARGRGIYRSLESRCARIGALHGLTPEDVRALVESAREEIRAWSCAEHGEVLEGASQHRP